MRILLPTLHVRRSAQAIPLATGCLKACLPQHLRQRTKLLDLFPEQSEAELLQLLLAQQATVIAFPLYLWNRRRILSLCRQLRQRQPSLFLVAGGPEASTDGPQVIAEGALDGVICGEGEAVFPLLLQALEQSAPTDIPGFCSAAAPLRPCEAAVCTDLAALPSPWLQQDLPLQAGGGVLWEVARGCRFNCAFCYDAKGQQGVRPLPLARLQAELDLFVSRRVGQVWILDSTFNAPPQRGKQLLRLLIERAPQIHVHLEAKADFLDQETAELLAQLSCSVQIGLQSIKPQVLQPLHRSIDQRQLEQRLQLLNQAGVTFGLDLIYGLPGDDYAGFKQSLDFALRQRPNQVDIFPLAVLPGTDLYQRQQQFGISAQQQPPYLIETNRSYSPGDLQASSDLAAATDLFYNRGRAVGVFLQLCQALQTSPSRLLENFAAWLRKNPPSGSEPLREVEHWQPDQILPLQQQFIAEQLRLNHKQKLQHVASDLLNYHFCCAETLLADDCQPPVKPPVKKQRRQFSWTLNPQLRIEKFNYTLEELERFGGQPLEKLARQLKLEPGYGIFFRQQGEIRIEALQEDFAQLLLAAKSGKSGTELLQQSGSGDELLQFAVAAGLLLPVT